MLLKEDTFNNVEIEPREDASKGIADLLIQSLSKVWESISEYNSIAATMTEHQYQEMVPVIQDILNDNSNHVGKLQQLIELISPDLEQIDNGQDEAIDILDNNSVSVVESFVDVDRKNKIVNINIDEIYDNYYSTVQHGLDRLTGVVESLPDDINSLDEATYILNMISSATQLIRNGVAGLESNCHEAFLELKSDYSRKKYNQQNESINDMKIVKENLTDVKVDDVQAVSTTGFALSQKEHDQFQKEASEAMKENEKLANETVPKEGETGKKVTSSDLKKMHLSESLFEAIEVDKFQIKAVSKYPNGNVETEFFGPFTQEEAFAKINDYKDDYDSVQIVPIVEECSDQSVFKEGVEIGDTVSWSVGNNRVGKVIEKTGSDIFKVEFESIPEKDLPSRIDYCYENELTKINDVKMRENILKESNIKYDIAKNQLTSFAEGKMKRADWNPKSYLENLVNKNHLSQEEATKLAKDFNIE